MMILSINKKNTVSGRRGFTLLEILVVISIIIMLASMVVGVGMYVQRLVMEKQTENLIQTLGLAAHAYASDYGGLFPPSHDRVGGAINDCTGSQGAGIQSFCSFIFKNKEFDAEINTSATLQKPDHYAEPKNFKNKVVVYKTTSGLETEVDYIVDAWGAPLFYYRPGAPFRNPATFDFWSAGPDSKSSTKFWAPDDTKYEYDIAVNGPWYYNKSTRKMVQAPPTGDPTAIAGALIVVEKTNDADCQEAVLDDIGNYKFVRETD